MKELVILSVTLFFTSSLFSATIRVPADQPTIQAGIDAASSLDTVLVQPGTYEELLNFNGKSVYLLGEFGPDSTILTYPVRCPALIRLSSSEDTLAVIDGFKIENVDHGDFAVIYIANSSATIRNCVFLSNTNLKPSNSSWGVVGVNNGIFLIVENCHFEDNQSEGTAGIGVAAGNGRIRFNTFVANDAYGSGGGGIGTSNASFLIEGNLFSNNSCLGSGGGIFLSQDNASLVRNNTFFGNTANLGGAIGLWSSGSGTIIERNILVSNSGDGITNPHSSGASFDYNNAYNNSPNNYGAGISIGLNSFSADPLFCDTSNFDFKLNCSTPCAPDSNDGFLIGAFQIGCLGIDIDCDSVTDSIDNCLNIYNPLQDDSDSDGIGDSCDECPLDSLNDIDNDTVCGDIDNCPTIANSDQTDTDNDGFGAACDCNDADSTINPNTVWYQDSDGDSYGNPSVTLTQCDTPAGFVLDSTDCNDADSTINPTTAWYLDADGDGFGFPVITLIQCEQPSGYVLDSTDCDDSDSSLNPNTIWYQDSDEDGYGNPSVTLTQCTEPAGYVRDNSDCDDTDSTINPNTVWYEDVDSDGFGVPTSTAMSCTQPAGFVSDSTDNCPSDFNPTQVDADSNGVGDACCCVGIRGDVNGDGPDANILDLTLLVDFIFRGSGDPGGCPNESDVNGNGDVANILDLTYLVDVIFRGGPVPPGC